MSPSPNRSAFLVYLLAPLLATTLLAACGGGSTKPKPEAAKAAPAAPTTTSPSSPNCRQVPPRAAQNITWVPADLPLPAGVYAVSDQGTSSDGVHHGVFALPITIREFVRFAVTQWPEKGWRLGRGDSEANEAEDEFVRGQQSGSFKVRSDYCDQAWSELNLFYKAGLQ